MTALNWILQEDMVVIVSDTLIVDYENSSPIYFIDKILPIVRAGTLIAGTGCTNCVTRAAYTIATQSVCRHVLDIDNGFPQLLMNCNIEAPNEITSTAYIFGWDDQLQMRGFAYR